jgi:hypothetical protein
MSRGNSYHFHKFIFLVYRDVEYLPAAEVKGAKFAAVRGSRPAFYGSDTWQGLPALLLAEGEWDAMLCWQLANDVCAAGRLGSASAWPSYTDLAALTPYAHILAVYDDDPAGEQARRALAGLRRIRMLTLPAHDLSDYFRRGGDLRGWIQKQVEEEGRRWNG